MRNSLEVIQQLFVWSFEEQVSAARLELNQRPVLERRPSRPSLGSAVICSHPGYRENGETSGSRSPTGREKLYRHVQEERDEAGFYKGH